ncbi:MAG: hypothetical protein HWE11_16300, partial [Gammaproteobacteria bacterium]|nr:hypothetical protein [Gammaproteobacteria bacterium]
IVDPKSRRVVDLYVHTSGENLSASLAKVFGLMMPDSKNFLKRLIGRPDINTDVAKVFQKVTQLNRQGRYQQSYQELKNLPQPVRESRVVSVMIVSFSSSVSDDVYQKELANLHRLFGDDEDLFLMMMDHYYFSEDYDRGITGLNRLNKRFNGDAAIEQLISSFNYLKQDYTSALKHINQAIELEADQVDYYWFKADILIAAKQFAQTLKVFDTIRDEFGITADPQLLRQDEQFKDLVASPEFKEWEKQQLNN